MWSVVFLILVTAFAVAGIWIMAKGKVVTVERGRYGSKDIEHVLKIRWIGAIVLGVAVLVFALMVMTTVPARTIAVTTAFGKPTGTIGNGFHLIAPWESTTEFDASIQTLKLSGDKDDNGEPINVRLANAATARVDVTVQWQIDPKADITSLFLDYREFEKIDVNVVRRQLVTAANSVFEKYDPLISLRGESQPVSLSELANDVKTELSGAMPNGILIRNVQIPKVDFDPAIQEKINQFQAAIAETQIAEQRQKTAEAQKRANDLLAQGNNTPGVLYQNCLDMVDRLVKEGKTLPPAFTCGTPPNLVVSVK